MDGFTSAKSSYSRNVEDVKLHVSLCVVLKKREQIRTQTRRREKGKREMGAGGRKGVGMMRQ